MNAAIENVVVENRYAHWRQAWLAPLILRETEPPGPSERLLHLIWQHQRLQRDRLATADGQPVRILHPGFHNREPGPDFRRAVVQFGQDQPRSGDVEIDRSPGHWRAHGHAGNAAFGQVILHVVWAANSGSTPTPPTLALGDVLDSPLSELAGLLSQDFAGSDLCVGRCASALRGVSQSAWEALLREAALVRLGLKAGWFLARAREAGWEQALWEGLCGGLGYKRNVWPMRRLGELRSRLEGAVDPPTPPALGLQARLLGVGGLLPPDLSRRRPRVDRYVRELWDAWWRERDRYHDCLLPRGIWSLGGLRPANHPQRRLALVAHWMARGSPAGALETWLARDLRSGQLHRSLLEVLGVVVDAFWSRRWTLNSEALPMPRPLLGGPRVTDLAVNVALPWLWMRAAVGQNTAWRERIEGRYFSWPCGEDNAVLRLARERMLCGRAANPCTTAAQQQGLLQIVSDFCSRTNALCDGCRLPELLSERVGAAEEPPDADSAADDLSSLNRSPGA